MLEKIGKYTLHTLSSVCPWTNVYGLARTLLAVSTLLTLLLNDATIFFRPAAGIADYPNCSYNLSIFCTVPNEYFYLNLIRWLCIGILLLVAIGWRPRITGVFHWWIAHSMQTSALTLDGGEQVSAVLTLLLLPLTLTDPRKWHWEKIDVQKQADHIQSGAVLPHIVALITIVAIRFQASILYLNAAVAKLKQEEWIDGTATYYFLNDSLLGMPPLLIKATEFVLNTSLVVVPTWGTFVAEILLFAALFVPKRYWSYFLYLGFALHGMIAIMIGLYSFSLIMFGLLILYLRPVEQEYRFRCSLKGFRTWGLTRSRRQAAPSFDEAH
ncbi:sporulation-delaying protein SdpB family protein [Paenibacillus ehimensis]|uniref:sporulation-delaying protein SdpB family protein n=1 Tax=Paenibacillus ehimensis TaxID=79264 RepID=UPI000470544E|nr:sporulation-delaying protein SdpB family protein [Paenibacillus ehimensis]